MKNPTKTIFLDIDGVLFNQEHKGRYDPKPEMLKGTTEKLIEWDSLGHRIILVTGRHESCREITKAHLSEVGIFYDQLIMGCGNGARVLINDIKPDYPNVNMATAINLTRNTGIGDITL